MKIACLCATYKRGLLLQNALACFCLQQPSPLAEYGLFILDDAGEFNECDESNVFLESTITRYASLPKKYQRLTDTAKEWGADAYAVWDDDDVFLPWHLRQMADAFNRGAEFYRLPHVWSNYAQKRGTVILEPSAGRFHSSWGYTRRLYETAGGYSNSFLCSYDQEFGARLARFDRVPFVDPSYLPSYVYRWGSGAWNISQRGEAGYQLLWDSLETIKQRPAGKLVPLLDQETRDILQWVQQRPN